MPRSDKQPCVYILASRRNGTLYIGVTSNLPKRVGEHKAGALSGFTRQYRVRHLVWFEAHERMESAILREKALKEWKRKWKIELIEATIRTGVTCTTNCFEVVWFKVTGSRLSPGWRQCRVPASPG